MANGGRIITFFEGDLSGLEAAMQRASQQITQTGQKLRAAGGQLTAGLTVPLVAVGGAAARVAATFDQEMTKIETLVGVNQNKVEEWRAQHLANNGGEPYWREAATLDLAQVARDVGFAEAKTYGLGERHYPWVTVATKA